MNTYYAVRYDEKHIHEEKSIISKNYIHAVRNRKYIVISVFKTPMSDMSKIHS